MPQQHQWYGNIRNDSLDATFQWRKWLSSTVSWPLASFSAAWSSERRPQQKFSWDRCVRGTASVRVRYLVSGDDFSIFFLWSACEKKKWNTRTTSTYIYIIYIWNLICVCSSRFDPVCSYSFHLFPSISRCLQLVYHPKNCASFNESANNCCFWLVQFESWFLINPINKKLNPPRSS